MIPNRQHVCIFTSAHPTDDVRVNSRIANTFLESGLRVTWVGPRQSYFSESTTPDRRITYRLFRPNSSRLRRLTAARAARRMAGNMHDVDWWYSPDPDAAAQACSLVRRKGGRVIFDIHEVFHGALLDRWFPFRPRSFIRQRVRRRVQRICRRADLVIGVSASVLRPYVSLRESKTEVVRNCAPRWFAEAQEDASISSEAYQRMRVMHGKAIPSNGAALVADALALLAREDLHRIQLLMSQAGAGSEFAVGLARRAADAGEPEALAMNQGVPHEKMPALLRSCDVGMVAYGRDWGVDSLPNRLFEYMAAGLPLLTPSYAAEIREIVELEGIGVITDFERPEEVAKAFTWFLNHRDEAEQMGQRARNAFLQRHNWDAEAQLLLAAMHRAGAT